ncbi:MAG: immune inhibitor A domain-containing protein, partial [Chloroflexota bacterium]
FGPNLPQNTSGVTLHALQKLDAAGFDFSPYADENMNIRNLIVIFAGSLYDESKDPNQHLQPSSFALALTENGPFISSDGHRANIFASCSELKYYDDSMANIGPCVHEVGHMLGMFDLYDLTFTTSGVGPFGVMGYGLWGSGDGSRPFQFSAYSKLKFGWVEPTIITQSKSTIDLRPIELHPNIIKLYPFGDQTSREYFLLENRQPFGFDQDWAEAGLCSGLLIWHIDETIIDNPEIYGVNNWSEAEWAPPHPGVTLVEADGEFELRQPPYTQLGECEDSWQIGRIWGNSSSPKSQLWSGEDSGLSVSILGDENGVLSLEIEVEEK